jgi:SSS family solute:Na+ symporter
MVGVSLVTRPASEERLGATVWSRRIWKADLHALQGAPWYRNWMVLSVLLLSATAVIVAWWW